MLEQIGYYHICALDPSILTGTDFDGLQCVFEGAWSRIVTAVTTAQSFGIGVLFGVLFIEYSFVFLTGKF
jgi:glucan 1,3-beta-glucosidase